MTTTPAEFRLVEPLRVRWAEVDAQGIVFNPHYLMYIDCAIAGYWRALAMPYPATLVELGGDLFLRRAEIDYLAPAAYDEQLAIGLRCDRVGNSSIGFQGAIFRGPVQLSAAQLVYVFAEATSRQPRIVPAPLRSAMLAFEAGEAMVSVRIGDWSDLGQAAAAVRTEVFVEEQGIPAALEWDDADSGCTHALAENRFGAAVGTARLLEQPGGVAKIGRMAVRRGLRGCGIGRLLLEALTAAARERGYAEVLLHAQLTAEAFYRAAGFRRRGEPFEEAGLPHVEMVRALEA